MRGWMIIIINKIFNLKIIKILNLKKLFSANLYLPKVKILINNLKISFQMNEKKNNTTKTLINNNYN